MCLRSACPADKWKRGGEFTIPESERSKLQGLYERYAISPEQADGPDTAEELS